MSIRGLFEKKKKRTREEINQEYNNEAVLFGHKSALLSETTKQLEEIEKELNGHLVKMIKLRKEASTSTAVHTKTESKSTETNPQDPDVA